MYLRTSLTRLAPVIFDNLHRFTPSANPSEKLACLVKESVLVLIRSTSAAALMRSLFNLTETLSSESCMRE